jgi:circadian clock protein KaiC
MASIGIDLRPWIKKGLLRFVAARPTATGLEMHLALMHRRIEQFQPRMVIVDPISNLAGAGILRDATTMLTRLIDLLKTEQITGVFTSLTKGGEEPEQTEVGISSLIDTWLLLRSIESGGERNRGLYVIKSRGMAHTNQIREFLFTPQGIELVDVYVGDGGVVTGSMRVAQEARERAAKEDRARDADSRRRASERRRRVLEAQIAALQADLQSEQEVAERASADERERQARRSSERKEMARSRKADASRAASTNGRGSARTGARN